MPVTARHGTARHGTARDISAAQAYQLRLANAALQGYGSYSWIHNTSLFIHHRLFPLLAPIPPWLDS